MSGSFESTFTSRRTLASAIIFPVAVNLSMPIGLPMQLAIFDKSRLDLRLNFKIWNFTQIGMEFGSSFWKLRSSCYLFRAEGCPPQTMVLLQESYIFIGFKFKKLEAIIETFDLQLFLCLPRSWKSSFDCKVVWFLTHKESH